CAAASMARPVSFSADTAWMAVRKHSNPPSRDCSRDADHAIFEGGTDMAAYKVGYFVGSLARQSLNRKLSKALAQLAPPELAMAEIPFQDLPLYSYDYDSDYPPVARAFKQQIADRSEEHRVGKECR